MKTVLFAILLMAAVASFAPIETLIWKPEVKVTSGDCQRKQGPTPPPCVERLDLALLAHGTYGRSRE